MKDQDKSPAQLIAEVNELRRKLADLEVRDTQMRTLLEQIPDGIFVTDMSGKFLEVNGRGCEMLGYEEDELLNLGLLDVISPENLKAQPLRMEELRTRKMLSLDRVWRRKDGVDIPVEIQARMLPDGRTQAFVHDISNRKETEAFLEESQERLDYALSTASDGFWDWNLLTNEVYFNDRWCESLGYDPDEVPKTLDFWKSLLHPDDRERVLANIDEYLAGKTENYLCEYRILTKSGAYRQNLDRGRVVARDEKGRPIRMVGTDTDISRQKEVEAALQKQEQQFRNLMEQAPFAIAIYDTDGSLLRINKVWEKIWGVGEETLMAFNPLKRLDQKNSPFFNFIKRAFDGGEVDVPDFEFDPAIFGLSGPKRWIRSQAYPIFDEAGRVQNIIVIQDDVSESKWSEQALSQRAVQLAILSDVAEKITAVLDPNKLLKKTTRLVQQSFGYHHVAVFTLAQAEEALVMRARAGQFAGLFPLNHQLEIGQGMVGWVVQNNKTLLTNDVTQEPRFFNKYPELIPTRSELTVPIRARNQVVGVLDVQSADLQAFDESDVMVIETLADQLAVAIENARLHEKVQQELNERIQAQLALEEHSERLEEMVNARTKALRDAQEQLVRQEKLAVLGQLSGSLAHELRNPLSAISSAAYLLGMFLTNAGPEVKEALEILTQEVRASERVINGLLGFARTKRPSCRTMHINDLLSDLMAHITLPPGVELDSRLDTAVPAMSADPDQLSQVFGNLIQNGLQAMHRGGVLTLSSYLDGTDQVVVQVHDTGVGIPAENLDKLFEPLFTTKAKGIGLGLSLVKNLVEGHGGRIEVTSEKDKGATFTVRLPLQEEPQKTN